MKNNLRVMACIFILVLAACQSAAEEATPPPLADTPAAPTSTPEPTSTPIPPTATVQPPSMLSTYLADVKVTYIDTFDTADGWSTYNAQTGSLTDGVFTITGQPDWQSGLARNATFTEGQGILLEFKYDRGSEFEFILDAGEWQTDSYRRFGVFGFGYPQANLTQGVNAIGNKNLLGNFGPRPDTWYNFMAGIGFDGNFIALIWDPSDTSQVVIYKEGVGEKWDNLSWGFTAKAAKSGMTLYLDNFAEISFSGIK
jgi:hypothetical protein